MPSAPKNFMVSQDIFLTLNMLVFFCKTLWRVLNWNNSHFRVRHQSFTQRILQILSSKKGNSFCLLPSCVWGTLCSKVFDFYPLNWKFILIKETTLHGNEVFTFEWLIWLMKISQKYGNMLGKLDCSKGEYDFYYYVKYFWNFTKWYIFLTVSRQIYIAYMLPCLLTVLFLLQLPHCRPQDIFF